MSSGTVNLPTILVTVTCNPRRFPKREAQRISDAKPRTSLRSYWHTLPKKKEHTPLKTRVRYNKAISVHRTSHGAICGRYRSYSSQPAIS
ncbi:hypothetical protein L1987_11235 [Smallanthus sonchifolius]|uniref:Uncharacterized protein n=1 Tax=Smallanthus sonchifolius TaxID=185202 RepID=A0ACB9JB88_9ASTR|nr:hypothetical protein L1987_11235 [Smallanthus sonchifolius]